LKTKTKQIAGSRSNTLKHKGVASSVAKSFGERENEDMDREREP
jgi:hypothetical protein